MKRYKLLPLSETMHYILLAVRQPLHGYGIMQLVKTMSDGKVNIAAGTLYGAIENLKKNGYIELISELNDRKKYYRITSLGERILEIENARLQHIIKLYEYGCEYDE